MAVTIEHQLRVYLQDAHAIELQALEQVRRAPKVAGDPEIAAAFTEHIAETERHERFVTARLHAQSWAPVPQKDIAGRITGIAMALFARFQPDTPGKLVAHAYSYERMEFAAYELLARLADRAGDGETALDARQIQADEREMADRLTALFDRAVDVSLADGDLDKQLGKYLADAHAIEEQAAKLLEKAPGMVEVEGIASAFEEHLKETEHHRELLEQRLASRGGRPSMLKDTALRAGALNLGTVFKSQVDVPAKLAAFAYAFEHLEIAAYELLHRVAARAQDEETILAIDEILPQERAAAARLYSLFDAALDASLELAHVNDELSGAGHPGPASVT